MERSRVVVDNETLDWLETDEAPLQPAFWLTYPGWDDELRATLTDTGGELYSAANLDVAIRLQQSPPKDEESGVLSLGHRVTGDLLLEASIDGRALPAFIDAVDRYATAADTDPAYAIHLQSKRSLVTTYEKRTLLLYDSDGTLLRHRSLIPTGIEI